jgi:hypothetical protein
MSWSGGYSVGRDTDYLVTNLELKGSPSVLHHDIWPFYQGFQLGIPAQLGNFHLDISLVSLLEMCIRRPDSSVIFLLVPGLSNVKVALGPYTEGLQSLEEFLLGRRDG